MGRSGHGISAAHRSGRRVLAGRARKEVLRASLVIAAATEDEILHAWYDEVALPADMGYGPPAAETANPDA
jgi:hypothetical protein